MYLINYETSVEVDFLLLYFSQLYLLKYKNLFLKKILGVVVFLHHKVVSVQFSQI